MKYTSLAQSTTYFVVEKYVIPNSYTRMIKLDRSSPRWLTPGPHHLTLAGPLVHTHLAGPHFTHIPASHRVYGAQEEPCRLRPHQFPAARDRIDAVLSHASSLSLLSFLPSFCPQHVEEITWYLSLTALLANVSKLYIHLFVYLHASCKHINSTSYRGLHISGALELWQHIVADANTPTAQV